MKRYVLVPVIMLISLALLIGCVADIKRISRESFRGPTLEPNNLSHETIALMPLQLKGEFGHRMDGTAPQPPIRQTPPAVPKESYEVSPVSLPSVPSIPSVPSVPGPPAVLGGSASTLMSAAAPGAGLVAKALSAGQKKREDSESDLGAEELKLDWVGIDLLVSAFRDQKPHQAFIHPAETLRAIASNGQAASYSSLRFHYESKGVIDHSKLSAFGEALKTRYILFTQLSWSNRKTSTDFRLVALAFGRSAMQSSITVTGQLWDARDGQLLWSGYGIGTSVQGVFDDPAVFESLALEAFRAMVNDMP